MIILQVLLAAVIILLLPLLVGFCLNRKTLSETWLFGQMLLWALFEVLAVPLMYFRVSYDVLFIVFAFAVRLLAVFGVLRLVHRLRRREKKEKRFPFNLFFLSASLVVLIQLGIYFFGADPEAMDTRWIGNAEQALATGFMRLRFADLYEYISWIYGKISPDGTPLGLYLAWMSRRTMIPPAELARVVFTPGMLLVSYCIYAQIGKKVFTDKKKEQGIFLLAVSVLQLVLYFAAPEFSLIAGWQEPALIPSLILPLLVLLILQVEREPLFRNWLLLACGCTALGLFSGMGVIFSMLLVMVYGMYVFVGYEFRKIPLLLLALVLPIVLDQFYANADKKITGLQTFGGVQYCFGEDGEMVTEGWSEIDGKRYYAGEDGLLQRDGWKSIDDTWYYFLDSGETATGWLEADGEKYYLQEDGALTIGWLEEEGQWYYFGENGKAVTGWQTIEEKRYWFDPSGIMHTGWETIDGDRYYFRESGAMLTGWLEDTEAEKELPEGQQQELWYWFDEDGKMIVGAQVIDGKMQVFDRQSGLWLYTAE